MAAPAAEAEGGDVFAVAPTKEFEADVDLTDAQRAKLVEMRTAVGAVVVDPADRAYWSTDHAYRRCLVARKWDVAEAAKMYDGIQQWRIKKGAAGLLTTYKQPAVLRRYFPWGFVGLDKEGFPVLIERVGRIDLIGITQAVGVDEFLDWVAWYHELQERAMRRVAEHFGKDRHKVTAIIDLGGLSMRHMSSGTLNALKPRTHLEEAMWPEVVKRVFLINTPSVFGAVWGVVKHFMDDGTVAKLQILGSNYLPTLLKFMDPSVIPQSLGGELCDAGGDGDCRALVGPGGLVPQAFLSGVAADGLGSGETVNVPAGKYSDVLLRVPAGATVSWRWASVDKDVAFRVTAAPAAAEVGPQVLSVSRGVCGVHQLVSGYAGPAAGDAKPAFVSSSGDAKAPMPYTAAGASEADVVHSAKVEKHFGSYAVPKEVGAAGVVVRLRWDNSFSWMASKTITRRVDVLLDGQSVEAAAAAAEAAIAAPAAAGAASAGAGAAAPASAAASTTATAPEISILVEVDALDRYAHSRMVHMETFGLPDSDCWRGTKVAPAGEAAAAPSAATAAAAGSS